MTQELAKKLKDAGFKFPKKNGCPNCWGDLHRGCDEDCGKEYDPTLSELIEACGGKMSALKYMSVGWLSYWEQGEQRMESGSGKTPEEAVANLWLKLKGQAQLKKGE